MGLILLSFITTNSDLWFIGSSYTFWYLIRAHIWELICGHSYVGMRPTWIEGRLNQGRFAFASARGLTTLSIQTMLITKLLAY